MTNYISTLARVTSWVSRVSTVPDSVVHHMAVTLVQNADPTNDPVTVFLDPPQTKSGQRETLALGRPRIFTSDGGLVGWWIWDAYLLPETFPRERVEDFGEDAYRAAAERIAGTDAIKPVRMPE
jgi:hypothetical protein